MLIKQQREDRESGTYLYRHTIFLAFGNKICPFSFQSKLIVKVHL